MDRKETYRLAIINEIRSQILYDIMSKSFKNRPESSITFKQLIPLEKLHEEKLRAAFMTEFPNETLEIDQNISSKLLLEDIDDPQKVIEYAISREEIAGNIYHDMAKETQDADLINLLQSLAAEEEYHKTILEQEITLLQGAMTWYDTSELDGLVED